MNGIPWLQDIKQPNPQLVEYLLQDDTLEELMHHLVDPPSENLEEDSRYSLPFAACEVICCEVSPPPLPDHHCHMSLLDHPISVFHNCNGVLVCTPACCCFKDVVEL